MRMSADDRARRRGAATEPNLSPQQVAWLTELLRDALASPRLNSWELGFIEGLDSRFRQYGAQLLLSEKQLVSLRKIEEKIHAAG